MSFSDPMRPPFGAGGPTREQLQGKWGWIVAMGAIFLFCGVAALYHVTTATLVAVIWIGAAMIVAGGAELVTAFQIRDWSRSILVGVIGALTVLTGFVTIQQPDVAAVTITMLIAIALVAIGVLKFIIAYHIRDLGPWGMVALSGLVSVLLGGMLLAQWPYSGMYALGLCLALGLIAEGVAWLMMGFAVKAEHPGAR
ncbi:MAG: HdeD family acid-resistance protein [Methylocystis sp.]|nr:HdeD family acid-resistance protein [Methylocystis sp.]